MTRHEIEQFILAAGSDDLPTFGGTFVGGIYAQQIPDEIGPCIHTLLQTGQRIDAYLEVGVAAGGLTYLIHHFFHPSRIVLVDTNEHPRCVNRPQVLAGIPYTEIVGKSGDPQTVAQVVVRGWQFDALTIDAVHYYENVREDVDNYLPLLRPGGFLMLHDSALHQWGVPRVVAELKDYPWTDFIGEWVSTTQAPCGVALFRKVAP